MNAKRSITTSFIAVISGVFFLANGISYLNIAPIYPHLQEQLELFREASYTLGGPVHGVAAGEYWRLFTVALTHANLIHLLLNMLAFYQIGTPLENFFGKAKYLALFFISLLSASLLSVYSGTANSVAVGASGAIYGLFGAMLVVGKRLGADLKNMLLIIGLNFAATFSIPGIDWRAHVGGFIGGAVVAYFLMFSKRT